MRIQKKWHNNQRIDGGRILVEIKVEVAVVYGRTDITIVNGKGTKPQTEFGNFVITFIGNVSVVRVSNCCFTSSEQRYIMTEQVVF
jgi:hypothetical protein